MSRKARLKPDYRDTWHHCYNHAVGTKADRLFGDADKEQFVRILHRVADLYTAEVVAYQVMSNHWHILLRTPEAIPSEQETIRRYEAFHNGQRTLLPGSRLCAEWQKRLRDVSWCMRHLQHLYTAWYNRTRPVRRKGTLWAGRFKNTVIEQGDALWACWGYVEANSLRANMVADPADYRFCSYGVWAQTGRHPFEAAVRTVLAPALPEGLHGLGLKELRKALREKFARMAAEKAGGANARVAGAVQASAAAVMPTPAQAAPLVGVVTSAEAAQQTVETATEPAPVAAAPAFTLSARRRVRHWVDGLVIGSERFIRETMRRVRTEQEVARQRLTRSEEAAGGDNLVCCWRRLRTICD